VIAVDGIVVSGSDFTSEFILFRRGNDTPLAMREAMVRFENATDISFKNSALLDAGHSAFWFQGKSQHITVEGNRIERPGFCGAYLQGIYPGDTWAGGDGDGTQGTVDGTPAWGPIKSSDEAYVNFGHSFSNNAVVRTQALYCCCNLFHVMMEMHCMLVLLTGVGTVACDCLVHFD